jgi:hypothetical protein
MVIPDVTEKNTEIMGFWVYIQVLTTQEQVMSG